MPDQNISETLQSDSTKMVRKKIEKSGERYGHRLIDIEMLIGPITASMRGN